MTNVELGEVFVSRGFPRLVEGVVAVAIACGWARKHSAKEKNDGKKQTRGQQT